MKGRKPTPTHLKVLNGNPGKRALNHLEPKPPPTRPPCPAWLSKEAKAEWKRIVPVLDKLGLLTMVDRGALATYCAAWARLVDAEAIIAAHGSMLYIEKKTFTEVSEDGQIVTTSVYVQPGKNPMLQVAKDASAIVRAFCAEFGLTPSSRSRMTVPEADDGMEGLLGARPTSAPPATSSKDA